MRISCLKFRQINAKNDRTFSETSETVWEISAKFKPLDEFFSESNASGSIEQSDSKQIESSPSSRLSENEKEYIEFYKECLTDDGGTLSPQSRKVLNKFALKCGLSLEHVATLEQQAGNTNISEDEQEYLNEYKEMMKDGVISPRERRLLDKIRQLNGITADRANELENMA